MTTVNQQRAKAELKPVPDQVKPAASVSDMMTRLGRMEILLIGSFMCMVGVMSMTLWNTFEKRDLSAAVAGLEQQVAQVEARMKALETSVSIKSAEDTIYLKALILQPKLDYALAREIAASIHKHAPIYRISPNLVLAMIEVESNFNAKATSNVGALGLMQLMPVWKEKQGITCDLFKVDCNIKHGMQVFSFYEMEYGQDLEMALTAYNRGPSRVDSALSRGSNPRNGYAKKIIKTYESLKAMTTGGKL